VFSQTLGETANKAMNVILDTNILRQDFSLKSNKFEALVAYLRKTDSHLVLPEVVILEAENLFRRELQLQLSKAKAVSDKLALIAFLETTAIKYSCDQDAEIKQYRALLELPRKYFKTEILPIVPDHMKETISRLIEGRKPASVGGKEFRDVAIWLSVKDYLVKKKSQSMAFISANTREFANDNASGLAPVLQSEISSAGLSLLFYSSIEDFLKQQASKIDFITQNWLEKNVPEDTIYDLALDAVQSRENRFERYAHRKTDDFSGDISIQNISPTIDDFFVYDMHTDGIYLNLTYYAEVELEIGTTEEVFHVWDEPMYHRPISPLFERGKKTLNPEVYLYFSARIINGRVVDVELDDWDLT
jgi:hypothetical protein